MRSAYWRGHRNKSAKEKEDIRRCDAPIEFDSYLETYVKREIESVCEGRVITKFRRMLK